MSALPPNWTTEAVPGTLSKRHDVLLTSERQRATDRRTNRHAGQGAGAGASGKG